MLVAANGNLFAQTDPASHLALRFADRVADSLALSNPKRDSLYIINMELHSRKMEVRAGVSNLDTLQLRIQRIENNRDSLYRIVLGEQKYIEYLHRKRVLLSAN